MNTHTNVQIIKGIDGSPAFVVMPYAEWVAQNEKDQRGVPHEVVNLVFDNNWTPIRAWREYLTLTQAEVAGRIGISQAAYAQSEAAVKPRKTTLQKIAKAMNLTLEQVDF
jgi:DNA-binding XRE family transcriptional regulator